MTANSELLGPEQDHRAQPSASAGMIYMLFKDAGLGIIEMRDVVDTAAISFHHVASALSKALNWEQKL
jgi:hypothetical protein